MHLLLYIATRQRSSLLLAKVHWRRTFYRYINEWNCLTTVGTWHSLSQSAEFVLSFTWGCRAISLLDTQAQAASLPVIAGNRSPSHGHGEPEWSLVLISKSLNQGPLFDAISSHLSDSEASLIHGLIRATIWTIIQFPLFDPLFDCLFDPLSYSFKLLTHYSIFCLIQIIKLRTLYLNYWLIFASFEQLFDNFQVLIDYLVSWPSISLK